MDHDRTLVAHTVVIRGDEIVAVGPDGEVNVPEDAERIEAARRPEIVIAAGRRLDPRTLLEGRQQRSRP